jgi:hypothetical protein
MVVIMKTQTIFNGQVLKPGQEVDLTDNVAVRWCNCNIAVAKLLLVDNVDKTIKEKFDSFDSSEVQDGISSLCGGGRSSGLFRNSGGKLADGRNKTAKKSK